MEIDFKPSVNLIRDKKREFTYLTTGNALRTADIICHDYVRGYRTFTLIGAYGTGKSSFMWAFQKSLEQQDSYFQLAPFKGKLFEVLPIVGEYASIVDYFNSLLVGEEPASSIKILEALEEYKGEADILLIQIDEFGKFLEYAVDNNPERELYFIQQLAEYVSDEEKGMLLLTSLHQNFEAYSFKLDSVYQRQEWKKINGRFKELTYNEPVEQLLYIASQYISKKIAPCSVDQKISGLIESHKIFQLDKRLVKEVEHLLYPLDLLSAIILAKLFQWSK